MALRLGQLLAEKKTELRYEPTAKRIRARRGTETVVDTTRAILVWEPNRVVPSYAVPGEELRIEGARMTDPNLASYVLLRFGDFEWLEEEEPIHGHPRDPYHRVDVRRSSRHARASWNGVVIAESSRPRLIFETKLHVRTYFLREDVKMERLQRTEKKTICAYKGDASYYSIVLEDGQTLENAVWTYEKPLPDAVEIAGLLAFFDERVEVTLDGKRMT